MKGKKWSERRNMKVAAAAAAHMLYVNVNAQQNSSFSVEWKNAEQEYTICSWIRHKELQHAEIWTTITERNPFFPLSVPLFVVVQFFVRIFILIRVSVYFVHLKCVWWLFFLSVSFLFGIFFSNASFSFLDSSLTYFYSNRRNTLFLFIRSHCTLLCHIYLCWLVLWNWSYLIFTAFRLPLLTSQMKYCFPYTCVENHPSAARKRFTATKRCIVLLSAVHVDLTRLAPTRSVWTKCISLDGISLSRS